MYFTPEAAHFNNPNVHPLSPERLADLASDSFREPISRYLADACDAWYEQVVLAAPNLALHPAVIQTNSEKPFAHLIHNVVQTYVSYDVNHRSHPTLDKAMVALKLDTYYYAFPPQRIDKQDARHEYQDTMMPYALEGRGKFLEIDVVLGIQRAFVARRQKGATRATYALLSSYGRTLQEMLSEETVEDTMTY
jgi:hypothetical protein